MTGSLFPPVAFLWPALAVASAGEMASAFAHELAHLGDAGEAAVPDSQWTTANAVALELPTMRLRDFSAGAGERACLVCAPFALHSANMTDLATGHSLVETLGAIGLARMLVTDWRTATPEMRFLSIDAYLADLNVAVDELGGEADLIGLCQGGWLALAYAARFPAKVRKLVLAGAPVDIAAGRSPLSTLAGDVPLAVFQALVEFGSGRMLGSRLLDLSGPLPVDSDAIGRTLQLAAGTARERRDALEARFRSWYGAPVDLPGAYYLQVVEWLFKQNRLAEGRFVALGRRLDLAQVRTPMFLVAAGDDEVVAPEQIFATERRVGTTGRDVEKAIAPGDHLGLFMGADTLAQTWPKVVRWMVA